MLVATLTGATMALSRVRMMYVSLAAVAYLLFPRFATWDLRSTVVRSFTVGLDLSVNIEMDVGVSVYNPNYVGAHLYNASMDLFRLVPQRKHTARHLWTPAIAGPAFGRAIAGSHAVPARGRFDLSSQISIPTMPMAQAWSFVREMVRHGGVVKVRGIGTALVRAAKHDMTLHLDCVQHVNTWRIPSTLEYSQCNYRLSSHLLSEYGRTARAIGPLLADVFSAMDTGIDGWPLGVEV